MRRSYLLAEPLKTKELTEALDRGALLWAWCEPTADARVHLFVQTSHADAILTIAEILPADSRGFQPLGSNENLTAAEVIPLLDQSSTRRWDGSFGGAIEPGLVDILLRRIGGLRPDALRRTSFNLTVKDARWKGSQPGSLGGFSLEDAKVFQRKVRFRIIATHSPSEELTPATVQTELNAILSSTGLDFRSGKRRNASAGNPWVPAKQANAALLFDHCIEQVSQSLLHDGFDWRTLAGVFASHYGSNRRFEAMARGGSLPFRWETRLTQFMKQACPEFRRKTDIFADAHTFIRSLEAPWQLAIVFDTHPGRRIGRVFKLRCGLVGSEESEVRFKRSAPMLRCGGGAWTQHHDWCPEFSFDTEAELEAILASLGPFLHDFLARIEPQLKTTLLEGWQELTSVMPEVREITAREADQLAREYLMLNRIEPGPLLGAALVGSVDSLLYRTEDHAQVSDSGKSSLFYHWTLTYQVMERAETVAVPFAGMLSRSYLDGAFIEQNPPELSPAVGDAWCDSDEAMRRFHAKRDELGSRYPELDSVVGSPQLTTFGGRVAWTGRIEFYPREGAPRGWVLVSHAIDAKTSEQISTTFDERFENRPKTREIYTEGGPPFYEDH